MKYALLLEEDQLKFLIKECIREVFMELNIMVSHPENNNNILTRKQAASYLQVTPQTLSLYVRQGKLSSAIINSKYRFFERDLINFLNNRTDEV